MRDRLAWVAGRLAAAADRRPPSSELAAMRAAVATDYADFAPFADPGIKPPKDDRMAELAEVFGVNELGVQLLTIAAGAELDANLALGYDLISGRPGPGAPTIGLALELAGVGTSEPAAFAGLGSADPLRQGRLLEVRGDGLRLNRTLRVPERVLAHLAGDDRPDPAVAALLLDVPPLRGSAAEQLARAVDTGSGLVWVHSVLGTAGTAVAAGGFAELGVAALVIDLRRMSATARPADLLADAAREAALGGLALVVAGADLLEDAADFAALAGSPVPVAAVGSRPWPPSRLRAVPVTIEAPLLTAVERSSIWTRTLGVELEPEPGHPSLANLRLSPEEILGVARHARSLAATRDEPLTQATLRDAARVLAAGAGGSGTVAARAPGPPATFEDLVLPERIVGELRRLVGWAAHRDEVIARGPVHGKGGKGSGITALFTGSPGTGKTLAAHVVADELNLELFQVDLSSVVDKYIGETEKNLERIFHEAESRNVVLFFDEADALFGKRSDVKDARDRYANQEVSYLLQRMEHFDGITVLATNLRGNLDLAFSRRMQFIVHFPDPDEATRLRLWRQHLDNAGDCDPDDPVDLPLLAGAVELAGGDIRNVVLAATYDAVSVDEPLGMRHVRAATIREFQKLGRRAPAQFSP